jgi:hypothetical protein
MYKWGSFLVLAALAGCQQSDQNAVHEAAKPESAVAAVEKSTTNKAGPLSGRPDAGGVFKYGLAAEYLNYQTPYIPPQCYTNPVDSKTGKVSNPCYVCHTGSKAPNYLNDLDVQLEYSFPEMGSKNHWTNIFKDRTAEMAKISDDAILDYVRQDNYFDSKGQISLAEKLKQLPQAWDFNRNGSWEGYMPDVWFNFDSKGFDHDPQGKPTGWRVFAYYPFLGTFMPTNGSTDDVMIRLPEIYRELEAGQYDEETYQINLAIVEALIKSKDVVIPEVDESRYGVDLDKDGKLGKASLVRFDWAPLEDRNMSYVGVASKLEGDNKAELAAGLYPVGTEFVHTVRYLDVDEQGNTHMARRMKELRYGRKDSWRNYYSLHRVLEKEVKERHDFPERPKQVVGNMENGMVTSQGWIYQGFIEDENGSLRPQSYEESYFCAGCHSGIGAITDTTFSFSRKFSAADSYKQGWYHWMEKGLSGVADPVREDGRLEYEVYLENNPSGNEFRTNDEVLHHFFDEQGNKRPEAFAHMSKDISLLLMPSRERALQLNKAYKVIVDEQSYIYGRDAIIKPLENVRKEVEVGEPTGIKEVLSYY